MHTQLQVKSELFYVKDVNTVYDISWSMHVTTF